MRCLICIWIGAVGVLKFSLWKFPEVKSGFAFFLLGLIVYIQTPLFYFFSPYSDNILIPHNFKNMFIFSNLAMLLQNEKDVVSGNIIHELLWCRCIGIFTSTMLKSGSLLSSSIDILTDNMRYLENMQHECCFQVLETFTSASSPIPVNSCSTCSSLTPTSDKNMTPTMVIPTHLRQRNPPCPAFPF